MNHMAAIGSICAVPFSRRSSASVVPEDFTGASVE